MYAANKERGLGAHARASALLIRNAYEAIETYRLGPNTSPAPQNENGKAYGLANGNAKAAFLNCAGVIASGAEGSRLMLPDLDDIGRCAIFLDLDGTIAELADHPDAVRVEPATLRLLERLRDKTGHALAVISGREIAAVDRLLRPLALPVAGVHGLQRRDAAGRLHIVAQDASPLRRVAALVEKAIGEEPGVVIEKKQGAVALHFRQRPELEPRCRTIAETAVNQRPSLRLLCGKMVFEIKLEGADKGVVIDAFLREAPFSGRLPIFAGDDVTDEVGFEAVNARGGISVKIGDGASAARFRAKSLHELREWFEELAGDPARERAR